MSRPRTATAILEARGAFKKDPQRKRDSEPVPTNTIRQSPPDHLTGPQQAAWRRIMGIALPGVIFESDELCVEMAACLWAEFQTDPDAMPTARLARLERLLSKLGMSPSDRAGLEVATDDGGDDW